MCDAGQKERKAAMQPKEIYEQSGYFGVPEAGPGTTGPIKQKAKKASGLAMFHSNVYANASSALLAHMHRTAPSHEMYHIAHNFLCPFGFVDPSFKIL